MKGRSYYIVRGIVRQTFYALVVVTFIIVLGLLTGLIERIS